VGHFKALVGVVETYGGAYGNKLGLLKAQLLEHGVLAVDVDMPNADELKLRILPVVHDPARI
jgi:hypothetical protein